MKTIIKTVSIACLIIYIITLISCGVNPCTNKPYTSVASYFSSKSNCSPGVTIVPNSDKLSNKPVEVPPAIKPIVTPNVPSPLLLSEKYEESKIVDGEIPLTISIGNAAPVDNAVVTSGVPFAIGQVSNISILRVVTNDGKNTPVAAQFTRMVSWPDGSVKVAMVSLIPLMSTNGKGYIKYKILYKNTQSTSNPQPVNPLKVTDNGTQFVVDNGVSTFVISKKTFTVFDQVKIGGVSQMSSPGDIVFVDNFTKNIFKTSLSTNYKLTLTEQGPIRSTFLATGRARALSGVNRFGEDTLVTVKLWMTFYANSGRVDLKYTWIDDVPRTNAENHWGGTHYVELISNSINLPLTVQTSTYAFGGNGTTYTGTVSGINYLLQDAVITDTRVDPEQMYKNPGGNGYEYLFGYSGVGAQTAKGATGTGAPDLVGGRAPGWMDITRGTVGVTAGIMDFWQNFPNKLSITDQGLMQIYIQPDESSNVMYTLAPGVGKTHDIFLDFHAGTDTATVSKRFQLFQEMPLLYAGATWYTQTKVFGPISVPDANSARWDTQIDYLANCSMDKTGCSIYLPTYGKRDYGDYIMGNGSYMFGNQHYEDAHGWILQYLRLGRKRYFNWSYPVAKHHYDLDVMHAAWPGYLSGYPAGMIHWHGGYEHEVSGVEDGHVVPGGIDELYLVTGDPRALDVSIEQGDFIAYWASIGGLRVAPEINGDKVAGVEYERRQAWPIYTVLKTYESTGDIKYWNAATIAIKNTIDWWKYPETPLVVFAPGTTQKASITKGSNQFTFNHPIFKFLINTNYLVAGPGIPAKTVVSSIATDTTSTIITMSNAATANGTAVSINISPNIDTRKSVESQAIWFEKLDWTKGNGYYLSPFRTDNSQYTNIPVSSDPNSWIYQNHVPVSWMGAYLQSSIIRYLENLKNIGGSYSSSIYYRGSIKIFTIDSPTLKEMLVQTLNMVVTHNFMGSGDYASVFPWMSNIHNNLWAYSIAPDFIAANSTSSDGAAQLPWVLLYTASFEPSELLQPSLWTKDWATLSAKWKKIARLSFDATASDFYLPGGNTGYNGAPILWNFPYAMSLMSP
jgi:hypothetical protein